MPFSNRSTPFKAYFDVIGKRSRRDRSQYVRGGTSRYRVSLFYCDFRWGTIPSPFLSCLTVATVLTVVGVVDAESGPRPMYRLLPYLGSYSVAFPVEEVLLPPEESRVAGIIDTNAGAVIVPLVVPKVLGKGVVYMGI